MIRGGVVLGGGTRSLESVVVVEGWAAGTGIGTAGSVASAVAGTGACVGLGRGGGGRGGDDLCAHLFGGCRGLGGVRGGGRSGGETRLTCSLVEGDVKSWKEGDKQGTRGGCVADEPQLLQTKEPSLSRLQWTEDVDAHWVQAVPGGGGGAGSSSIGSTGDWGREGSPVRESEEEAWSDGGGVWMAADMIWGKGRGKGGCAGKRERPKFNIYSHPITARSFGKSKD